jgi:phospholipid-translocating ATPase
LIFFRDSNFVDMELKRLHMGTMSYGVDSMDEIKSHIISAFEQRQQDDPDYIGFRAKRGRDMSSRVRDIVLALGLCHNVT